MCDERGSRKTKSFLIFWFERSSGTGAGTSQPELNYKIDFGFDKMYVDHSVRN